MVVIVGAVGVVAVVFWSGKMKGGKWKRKKNI